MTTRSIIPGRTRACAATLLLLGMVAPATGGEVRGVSLAHLHRHGLGYGSDSCRDQLVAIAATGANWVAINDYAYMKAVDQPLVRFGTDPTMREADLLRVIRHAHAAGLKVLLKPHLWSGEFRNGGKWHGDIRMTSEADWDAWFEQYTRYVLFNASIANQSGADSLCVGVEYVGTSRQEQRWRKLVSEVRKVYRGPLTYAASFTEWRQIEWWDALDCIGIDAYWPVAKNPNASERELRQGWADVYAELEPFARRIGKPICFTELGYSDSALAGKEPWSYQIVEPDPAYQARLYRVALEEANRRDWVCGVFVWKWFTSDSFRRVEGRDPFAMQDRPQVLDVLRKAWSP